MTLPPAADAAPPELRPASTVIVLRDAPAGPEVLLIERRAELRFMGGMWVFPGGSVDSADATVGGRVLIDRMERVLAQLERAALRPVASGTAPAIVVAALRELHEEAGLLPGTACAMAGAAPFAEAIGAWLARPDDTPFVYWARWLTPSGAARRFDTHFFATAVGSQADVRLDERESSRARWWRPADAIDVAATGELALAPPTRLVLLDLAGALARASTVRTLLSTEDGRCVLPILPRLGYTPDGPRVLMPWDPEYATGRGEGIELAGRMPPHWHAWPSRLVPPMPLRG